MKTEKRYGLYADFRMPDKPFAPVIVNRFHADGDISLLGRIYQDYGNGDGILTYVSVDNHGEELFPRTEDWCAVESSFEKYAKTISQREEEINMIRAINNNQQQTINR